MHGKVQSSQYRYIPSLHGTDPCKTRHVSIRVNGKRTNGQVSRFFVKQIDADGFSAEHEDHLENRELITFNFVGYGLVNATLQYVLGVEARFSFHSTLSHAEMDEIQRSGGIKSTGFFSASCGVTPTLPTAV